MGWAARARVKELRDWEDCQNLRNSRCVKFGTSKCAQKHRHDTYNCFNYNRDAYACWVDEEGLLKEQDELVEKNISAKGW